MDAPIRWLMFYDVLLCVLEETGNGRQLLLSVIPGVGMDMQTIALGTLADDLSLSANSRASHLWLADGCATPFILCNTETSCSKMVHIVDGWQDPGWTQASQCVCRPTSTELSRTCSQ